MKTETIEDMKRNIIRLMEKQAGMEDAAEQFRNTIRRLEQAELKALAEVDTLDAENARLRDVLADMVSVAESQGWDNAEIHNARDMIANLAKNYAQSNEGVDH